MWHGSDYDPLARNDRACGCSVYFGTELEKGFFAFFTLAAYFTIFMVPTDIHGSGICSVDINQEERQYENFETSTCI
jgi:hypothetical protein